MKKAKLLFLVVLFCMAACGKDGSAEPVTTPVPEFDEAVKLHEGLDIIPETDYSNIIADTESDSYPAGEEKIKIRVLNQNPGKGFYIYSVLYLEQETDKGWVPVAYNDTSYPQWLFVGEEGNREESNYTYLAFYSEDLPKSIVAGNYRFVLYVKERTLYVPVAFT